MRTNLGGNDFLVIYGSLDGILISGFDLGWYFSEQGLQN